MTRPSRFRPIPVPPGYRVVHLCAAATLLWLGLRLVSPGDTFATSPAFNPFLAVMPEPFWGKLYLALGLFCVAGAALRSRLVRLASLTVAAATMTGTGTLMAVGSPISTGTGTYLIWAVPVVLAMLHDAGRCSGPRRDD